MNILMTGGTGFIGSALTSALRECGHQLTILTRRIPAIQSGHRYILSLDEIESEAHYDAVINLAGASLAQKRWSAAYKAEILDSRLKSTSELIALLERLDSKPSVLLSASAIGYYGHHGDEPLDEDASRVPGFAQKLCLQWEEEALAATRLGVRVCLLRFGVVLGSTGGAMVQMGRPFQFGVANWLGSGHQWLSWVHLDDVLGAIVFLLEQPRLEGPFNITAPEPVTSRGFCEAMKRYKRTFITASVPGFAMRVLVGEMADELLLNGQRVMPAALTAAGFEFQFPDIDAALDQIFQPKQAA